jgi:hypothetical protein
LVEAYSSVAASIWFALISNDENRVDGSMRVAGCFEELEQRKPTGKR